MPSVPHEPARGVVAAGHPAVAEVGAAVLREGGNAIDAALAALMASWPCEPLLTGPAGGGYLLVAGAGQEPTVLDGFCAAPGLGGGPARSPLLAADVDFGDAQQTFYVGGASVAAFGLGNLIEDAHRRWGSLPLADLAEPGAQLAQAGVPINDQQAYVARILIPILQSGSLVAELWAPGGRMIDEGDLFLAPGLADTIRRIGAEGGAPLSTGDLAAACVATVQHEGGPLTARDLAEHTPTAHAPLRLPYRDRTVLITPPSSAGGTLLALSLAALETRATPPTSTDLAWAMDQARAARTPEFAQRLVEPGYADALLGRQLGGTTHISALDANGLACSVTCSNGENSGILVPDTGIHLNNVMGEEDLNPLGFGAFPPGRRMPSMMCPTAVLGPEGKLELALGSAGSNRIRSALLRTIVAVVDEGLPLAEAVDAARLHREGDTVYIEPGVDPAGLLDPEPGHLHTPPTELVEFREKNLFFGGVQAVGVDPLTGNHVAGGDPRRGGAVAAP